MPDIPWPTDLTNPTRSAYATTPWTDPNGKQWTYEAAKNRWNPFLPVLGETVVAAATTGGDGVTDLSYSASTTTVTIASSTGSDATILAAVPAGAGEKAGVMTAADKSKLDGIAAGAQAGTVTSVALSLPNIITVSGSPITTSGTLTGTLATQTANYVWAGPTSGGASAPTFRALVAGDIPSHTQASSTITIPKLGSPTYYQIEEYLNATGSSGYFDGAAITDAGGGSVNIAAGKGFIRATSSTIAQLVSFEFGPFTGVAIPSDSVRYVYVSYNSGTPVVVLSSTVLDEAPDKIVIGLVANEGGAIISAINVGVRLAESIGQAGRWMRRVFGFQRDAAVGGLVVGETGTRNLTVSAGLLWYGRTEYTIDAIDTSGADRFDAYYQNGAGGWTKQATQSQWENTLYDDGDGTLGTMTVNRYGVRWIYLEADGDLVVVYGTSNVTTAALAEAEAPPTTLPVRLQGHGVLAARLVFQKSAATASSIASAFTTQFTASGAASNHADLANLQGGTAGEYYHLTSAQATAATAAQAAGTESIRAIGTTATTAAAGNHAHSTASTTAAGFVPLVLSVASDNMSFIGMANGETDVSQKTLYDATNPAALGTAAPGSSLYAARRDHVHPAQTTITGNAGTATALATARTIAMTGDVTWSSGNFDGSGNVTAAGTIASGAVTLAKMANIDGTSAEVVLGRSTASSGAPELLATTGTRGSSVVLATSPTLVTPALGTPSSGTLTSCTGLPISGLVASTATAIGVGSIELGHASDTTIARVSPGVVSIEGSNILTAATGLPLAGGTMTGAITLGENASIALDPSMSADERWSGITMDGTAGETLAVGDLCYLDATATEWMLADADAAATAGPVILGICVLAGGNAQATRMLTYGTIRSAAFPASIAFGAPVYVSGTAGDITATAPSGTAGIVRVVGHAVTAEPNTILFNPSQSWVELA